LSCSGASNLGKVFFIFFDEGYIRMGILDILGDGVVPIPGDEDGWTVAAISTGGLLVAGYLFVLLLTEFEVLPALLCGGYIALYIFLALRNKKQAVLFVVVGFVVFQLVGVILAL
jgi:hypothetical protein